ncbi:MAG TPA: heme-binding protein [Baekduia sp.]|uniref:GlcG/HbpS family heme-binding protein n=1 Tax=Baekduia sp. TaxID=2600305 RepID=UPI002B9B1348|nr:heme-binding protein [Baekduia sp.]HMJ36288.1 heme-binding protein [Baekduia sp.]
MALSTNTNNDGGTATRSARTVTLSGGQAILEAARVKATEIGVPMNIAVIDEGGNLVAFARMDDAWLGSIDIAQSKAYTARAFDMPTKDLAPLAQPGGPLYGIEASNRGRVIVFAGGIPLVSDGRVVGAIGVSGGSVEQDQEVAEAGAAAF